MRKRSPSRRMLVSIILLVLVAGCSSVIGGGAPVQSPLSSQPWSLQSSTGFSPEANGGGPLGTPGPALAASGTPVQRPSGSPTVRCGGHNGPDPCYTPPAEEQTRAAIKEGTARAYGETQRPNAPAAWVAPTPDADLLPTDNARQYGLNDLMGQSKLSGGFFYFTYHSRPDGIYRISLPDQAPVPELVVSSAFPDGSLDGSNLLFAGDWLIFSDLPFSGGNSVWRLRAHNPSTGEDRTLLDEPGDAQSWPGPIYSADGDRVAWTHNSWSEGLKCTVNILGVTDLRTGEVRELDRGCADFAMMWSVLALTGNRLIVEQDMADNLGGGNRIWLFDLSDSSRRLISGEGNASMPVASGSWVVWKDVQRYDHATRLTLYNLEGGASEQISTCAAARDPSDPSISGDWIFWVCRAGDSNAWYAYRISDGHKFVLMPPGPDLAVDGPQIGGGWMTWGVGTDIHGTGGEDILLWRPFP